MDLHVELLGAEIVVTRPGTAFMTAYRKRPDGPTLKLTRSWVDIPGSHLRSRLSQRIQRMLIDPAAARSPSIRLRSQ